MPLGTASVKFRWASRAAGDVKFGDVKDVELG